MPQFERRTLPLPFHGLNTKDEPTLMHRMTSPDMKNIEIDRSSIRKRLGYIQLGQWLPLLGTGMELIQYVDGQGGFHHIALTTRHAYEYQDDDELWLPITPSTLIDDCESAWTAGSGDTVTAGTAYKVRGSKSVKIALASEASDGDKLAYTDYSSADLSSHTQIGFWLRSDTALSSGDLEIVVSESANGAKSGTYTESTNDSAMSADTWYFFSIDETLTDMDAAVSVALYANSTIANGTNLYIDDVRAYTEFTGSDVDRFSHTLCSNTTEFTNNGGTALVISNGADGLFYYEGHSGDTFNALSVSADFSSFSYANEIEDFWNHLWLFNYKDGTTDYVRNAAFHDVSSDTYNNLDVTETILTDSQGPILRAKKLGFEMIIYSGGSITVAKRVGGSSLFVIPTVIYETGLFAEKGLWEYVNRLFFLGSDKTIYLYTGGAQLDRIGLLVEDQLFEDIDASKSDYIVMGLHPTKHKLYIFYPTVSDEYSSKYLAYNFKKNPPSWEKGEFADSVADFSHFQGQTAWRCSSSKFAGVSCNDEAYATTQCRDGIFLSGYVQPIFLSRDGYVFQLTGSSATDDTSTIEAYLDTPDLIGVEGRTDEETRFGVFAFSAKCNISGGTLDVKCSTDGGSTWTDLDTVNLTTSWEQYRIPVDITAHKIRFRWYQNSNEDFELRSSSCTLQLQTDR